MSPGPEACAPGILAAPDADADDAPNFNLSPADISAEVALYAPGFLLSYEVAARAPGILAAPDTYAEDAPNFVLSAADISPGPAA